MYLAKTHYQNCGMYWNPKEITVIVVHFETVPELLSGLKEYFEFYNFVRPHQSLVWKTPAAIYWARDVVKKAA
jgi:hypothetical protein